MHCYAFFSSQVLQIAEKFTDNDLGYALYPTDITLENLAVTDKEEVMFIDAENILVVDREQIRKGKNKGQDSMISLYLSPIVISWF